MQRCEDAHLLMDPAGGFAVRKLDSVWGTFDM